jgi:hypothetical protein
MRRYLFAGPSLPDASSLLSGTDVTVLPPVESDDLLRLPLDEGDVVGIVDGYFHQTRAVRHKEILSVLARGVRVFGASSIGALRAAELDVFGMEGLGEIYQWFRSGRIEGDDEVALLHGEADDSYRAFSEPLVNIRATLGAAQRAGVIAADDVLAITTGLSGLPYPRRTYSAVVDIAVDTGLPTDRVRDLKLFCVTSAVNLKRADASRLVDALITARRGAARCAPGFERTLFLRDWELAARGRDTGDGNGWIADMSLVRAYQLFAAGYPHLYRRLVLARIADECREECAGPADASDLDLAAGHGVHRGLYGEPTDSFDGDFLTPWLTAGEARELPRTEQVARFLVRSYALGLNQAEEQVIEALEEHGVFQDARWFLQAATTVIRGARNRSPDFDPQRLSEDRLVDHIVERWGVRRDEAELAALDRGFLSLDHAVKSSRPYYLLAKFNAGLLDLLTVP